jgi:hypothetical protein
MEAPSLVFRPLDRRLLLESALATLIVASIYLLLWSQLPVDDTQRYVGELRSNAFHWDIAHILMQPLALVVHRLVGGDALLVLKTLNTISTSLAIGVLYLALAQLGVERRMRLAAAALTLLSFNYLAIAPTGHIKCMVLPFLALAFTQGVIWSVRVGTQGQRASAGHLLLSALALGSAGGFLVSSVPVLPFMLLAIGFVCRRAGEALGTTLAAVAGYAVAAGLAGLLTLLIGFLGSDQAAADPGALIAFIHDQLADKHSLHAGYYGVLETLFRVPYALVNNFVQVYDLGPILRAWMGGLIDSLAPFSGVLLRDATIFLATGLVLLAVYAWAAMALTQRDAPAVPVVLAFLGGNLAFTLYVNLNDPEHWFQFTIPTLFLLAIMTPVRLRAALVVVLFGLMSVVNLGAYALPKKAFPLERLQVALDQQFDDRDLFVYVAAYAARASITSFDLDGVRTFKVDLEYEKERDPAAFSKRLFAAIDGALDAGGDVVVFRLFDPLDWHAPFARMAYRGLGKDALRDMIETRYDIGSAETLLGLTAWRIRPRDTVLRPAQARRKGPGTSPPSALLRR